DGNACVMSCGRAWYFPFDRVRELADAIENFGSDQGLTSGGLRPDLVTTKHKLDGETCRDAAHTCDFFKIWHRRPGTGAHGFDKKGPPIADNIEMLGGGWLVPYPHSADWKCEIAAFALFHYALLFEDRATKKRN